MGISHRVNEDRTIFRQIKVGDCLECWLISPSAGCYRLALASVMTTLWSRMNIVWWSYSKIWVALLLWNCSVAAVVPLFAVIHYLLLINSQVNISQALNFTGVMWAFISFQNYNLDEIKIFWIGISTLNNKKQTRTHWYSGSACIIHGFRVCFLYISYSATQ